jgi:hypothetical protein
VASYGATIAYFMWHNKMEKKKSEKTKKNYTRIFGWGESKSLMILAKKE